MSKKKPSDSKTASSRSHELDVILKNEIEKKFHKDLDKEKNKIDLFLKIAWGYTDAYASWLQDAKSDVHDLMSLMDKFVKKQFGQELITQEVEAIVTKKKDPRDLVITTFTMMTEEVIGPLIQRISSLESVRKMFEGEKAQYAYQAFIYGFACECYNDEWLMQLMKNYMTSFTQ